MKGIILASSLLITISFSANAESLATPTADNLEEWAEQFAWQRTELLSVYEEELYQWLDENAVNALGTGAYPKEWYNKVVEGWGKGIALVEQSRELMASANQKYRTNHAQCKERLDFYFENHYPNLIASYEEFKKMPEMLAENPYTPIFIPDGTVELAAYLDTAFLTCSL